MKKLVIILILFNQLLQAEEIVHKYVKYAKINMLIPERLYPMIPHDRFHMNKIVDGKKVKIKRPPVTLHCNNCGQCFINFWEREKRKQYRFELNSGILKAQGKKAQIECRKDSEFWYRNCKVKEAL